MKNQHDPQRQTCKVCCQPDKFDFYVPDDIWNAVIPDKYKNHVVCLYCFDFFARQRNVEYANSIDTLYFAGDKAVFKFKVDSAMNVV